MKQKERTLNKSNIDSIISEFTSSIEGLGTSINGKRGVSLLVALKRDKLTTGPYPGVTLFEAANRIMTDLVILHGVSWLLKTNIFPFESYTVEFGNEDHNGFDITAKMGDKSLVGEAFNVAPSFFQIKKSAMVKKLRNDGASSDFKIIMVNADAVTYSYCPKEEKGLYYVIVDIATSSVRIIPKPASQDI